MTTQKYREAKKVELNLNYLANDLDIFHHRVLSWLEAKSPPQQQEIEKFGIEVVRQLCIRKVFNDNGEYLLFQSISKNKKKDILVDKMKFRGLHLTPRRPVSANPIRPTTPHVWQKRLDFNDDEDGYKVDADINPATCTCAHNDTLYQCRISVLEKQTIMLLKELQVFESEANEYTAKFRDLKNMIDSRNIDACPDCKMKEQHMQRYKAERNELIVDRHRLEKLLANRAEENKQHIDDESKFQQQISHLKFQYSRSNEKVTNAETKLEEMTSKYKEQRSLFTLQLCQFEREMKELRLKLREMRNSKDNQWVQQMKQEVQELNEKIDELQKENIMLNATVDEKVCENLRLDTELQSLAKEKERPVTILKTEMDELRKELIDKHVLIDQAHKTLSRSKSLCDLTHHSKEEIKIRSNLITRMCRESNEKEQQTFKDHTETLNESTGRSLQFLMQNSDNDDYLPQDETGMFGLAEDLTERERTAQGIFEKLSMASKTTTVNNYHIITTSATIQKDCFVDVTTANANSDRAITDS